ncbi:hypothetical protein RND81_11G153000 [Saponaria officinalis]|uniref:Uncharacterized protein n=1 Tax=Saponaria officinalis TaxID=3572 RepID=A0AAW1HLG3_SAPOF
MLINYAMQKLYSNIILLFILINVGINGVQGGTMVSGTVFCDQCKDGQVSMFDYPLSGMKVAMMCPGSDGQMTKIGEDTTNMLGSYGMSFDGTPNLSTCFTQISPNPNGPGSVSSNSCGSEPGPPKSVKLIFSMFGMAMYMVDPLISQPSQPMSYCPRSSSPSQSPSGPVIQPPPVGPVTPETPLTPPKAPSPAFRLPPMPGLPPLPPMPGLPPLPPMPPAPFVQETACPYAYWMMPEYKCNWRVVNPDMSVALVFGPLAAQKYGTDMTLYKGLQGKGDPYMTLLREGVTSLLNSYNSLNFSYNPLQVFHHFNEALLGSNRTVLLTALRFKRANYGHDHVPCKLNSCQH